MNQVANTPEQLALRKRLAALARLMDSSIRVPVIGKRIGWDAVLGLIPGAGDIAGALISGYIVVAAYKLGVPRSGLGRMLGNIGIETLLGIVPVFGDFFDMAFKANERNVALMEKYVGSAEDAQHLATTQGQDRSTGARLAIFLLGFASVVAAGAVASRLLASAV